MAIMSEVGQDEVAARCHPAGESPDDAPRVVIVRYAMQNRNEQDGDRLGKVDQPAHAGIGSGPFLRLIGDLPSGTYWHDLRATLFT